MKQESQDLELKQGERHSETILLSPVGLGRVLVRLAPCELPAARGGAVSLFFF